MRPTLASAARAIEAAVHPGRVDVLVFGEQIRDVHVVLMPCASQVPENTARPRRCSSSRRISILKPR